MLMASCGSRVEIFLRRARGEFCHPESSILVRWEGSSEISGVWRTWALRYEFCLALSFFNFVSYSFSLASFLIFRIFLAADEILY